MGVSPWLSEELGTKRVSPPKSQRPLRCERLNPDLPSGLLDIWHGKIMELL